MKEKHNYNLDIIKIICTMMVVLIHVSSYIFHSGIDSFVNYWIYRDTLNYAVPIFFATSGYLVFSMKDNESRRRKYENKILKFFLLGSLFYFFTNSFFYLFGLIEFNPISRISPLRVIHGTWGEYHLWYLWALYITLLLQYNIGRKFTSSFNLVFSIILYSLFSLYPDAYLSKLVDPNGGIVLGMLYFNVGYVAHKLADDDLIHPRQLTVRILLLVVFILNYYLGSIIRDDAIIYGRIVFIFLLFYMLHGNPGKKKNKVKFISEFCLGIYIIHVMVIVLLRSLFGLMTVYNHSFPSSIFFSYLLTIMICIFVTFICKKILVLIELDKNDR